MIMKFMFLHSLPLTLLYLLPFVFTALWYTSRKQESLLCSTGPDTIFSVISWIAEVKILTSVRYRVRVIEEVHTSLEEVMASNAEPETTVLRHHQNNSRDQNEDEVWCDDESLCDDLNQKVNVTSDLDREWHRRHGQFHTIGYRDGLTAGKEAAAQEGFNAGFKQSVLIGYKWGLVRGVTSALACFSTELKEKLAGTQETREKFQNLYDSVSSVSTQSALRLFHTEILLRESEAHSKHTVESSHVETASIEIPNCSQLGKYIGEFESLLEPSAIKLHSGVEKNTVG